MIKHIINYFTTRFHRKIIIPLSIAIYKHFKIKHNKIVIDNFGGKGFGDNPKYIVKLLLQKNPNLDIVWLVNSKNKSFPAKIRTVKYDSIRSMKELLTASVWIDNIKVSSKPPKRLHQFYLQTWHAGIGIKACEQQVESNLSDEYVRLAKEDAKKTDLMLSDSDWTTNIYSNYFWYTGPVIKTGFPRNDILISKPRKIINKVYAYYKIPREKKILLYAPTFRDFKFEVNIYQHKFNLIRKELNKKFDNNFVILIRLHPNVANILGKKLHYKFNNGIYFNATDYPDMQELIVASDTLITDYSSCMFDAMIAQKKVFLLTPDLVEYEKNDRNLLFNIKKDLPFSVAQNDLQLCNNINNFDLKKYLKKVKDFEKKLSLKEDGLASERVAKIILNKSVG